LSTRFTLLAQLRQVAGGLVLHGPVMLAEFERNLFGHETAQRALLGACDEIERGLAVVGVGRLARRIAHDVEQRTGVEAEDRRAGGRDRGDIHSA
jgi:hypothetical protein